VTERPPLMAILGRIITVSNSFRGTQTSVGSAGPATGAGGQTISFWSDLILLGPVKFPRFPFSTGAVVGEFIKTTKTQANSTT